MSTALHDWNGQRSRSLDSMVRTHKLVTGERRGRPPGAATVELNHALHLRLASEFQGFRRDLHDEAIDLLLAHMVPDPSFSTVVRAQMINGRKLDSGNANAGNLGDDFSRIGMTLWADLKALHVNAPEWNKALTWLNKARNGLAHNDRRQIEESAAERPLTLRTFQSTRRTLDRFNLGLDGVVSAYLGRMTGAAPW